MCKIWTAIYEYGPHQSDDVLVVASNEEIAKNLTKDFLIKQHLWDRVGFGNITIWPFKDKIPIYKEILMEDFFLHNVINFFRNGEADMSDLLDVAQRYSSGTESDQVTVLIALNSILYTQEFNNLFLIPKQREFYEKMASIINEWESAWITFLKQYPRNLDLCKNQAILAYSKIVS